MPPAGGAPPAPAAVCNVRGAAPCAAPLPAPPSPACPPPPAPQGPPSPCGAASCASDPRQGSPLNRTRIVRQAAHAPASRLPPPRVVVQIIHAPAPPPPQRRVIVVHAPAPPPPAPGGTAHVPGGSGAAGLPAATLPPPPQRGAAAKVSTDLLLAPAAPAREAEQRTSVSVAPAAPGPRAPAALGGGPPRHSQVPPAGLPAAPAGSGAMSALWSADAG